MKAERRRRNPAIFATPVLTNAKPKRQDQAQGQACPFPLSPEKETLGRPRRFTGRGPKMLPAPQRVVWNPFKLLFLLLHLLPAFNIQNGRNVDPGSAAALS